MQSGGHFVQVFIMVLTSCSVSSASSYSVSVVSTSSSPLLSFVDGSSSFQEVFNPTFVPASSLTQGQQGLLIRSQNCTLTVGSCSSCGGQGDKRSVMTASIMQPDHSFSPITADSVVFQPVDQSEACGTEDPRVQFDPHTALYYLFYTAYDCDAPYLYLATTSGNPLLPNANWTRHGAVFPGVPWTKSAALLVSDNKDNVNSKLAPYYLLWGDENISITNSSDATNWVQNPSTVLLSPRADKFDSGLVESGPPPLRLSTGDYLFLYNSATKGWPKVGGYHVGYLILSGANPYEILQRSDEPLLSPDTAWEQGVAPYTCNVPNVVFLEGATPIQDDDDDPSTDSFRVFFGGADTVVGDAIIRVTVANDNYVVQ